MILKLAVPIIRYFLNSYNLTTIVLVYIDDIIITRNYFEEISRVKMQRK
jgi:hypothetical protein